MYRKRTAPDASPEAVKQMTEARRERSPEKRAIPPLRASMRMHSKSRGAMMVEAAKKNKDAQKSPVRSTKSSLPLVPSTPQKRKDPRPSQLIQYGKEKPDNNLDALFKRRKEQQQSISGFRGMENLGNTCYMNAVLQVLTSLDTFASDMQNKQLLDASMPEDGVYKALLQVTKEKKLTGMSRGINPVALKRSVAKNSSRFEGARQQDAHEFLCNLLDQVQEEVFHHYEKKLLPQDSSKLQLQDTRCPTSLNFSCIVEHELVCDSCGESSEVRELFRHLSLDIPERKPGEANGPPNLQELLELYFKDEPLEKTCEKCGCLTCTVKHRVRRLPRVLVLHMKRFCVKIDGPVQRYVKRQDPVRIEPLLNLRPVCCPLTKGPIPFGDQARPSPSQNKAPKTPQSPRRTLADVSNTWQAAAGESPAKSARRASISASSGAFLGPEAVGRIRGGFSVASDGSSGSGIREGSDVDSGETSGERNEGSDVRMDEANAEGDACPEEDTASSMEGVEQEPRRCFSHAELASIEPQRLRGGGAEPDSDPYALEPTASELLEQSMSEALERTMRDRAAEMEAVNSGRIAERKRASAEAGLSARKPDSIYTRASPYETSDNPYEAYKNLPPGARFGTATALKVAERSQTPGTQTPRLSATAGKRGEPVIRKPGKSISTVKNLFKSAGEKREEEAAMLFSPGSKRPKTRAERAESRIASVVDLEPDEDAELARVLAESEKEFAAQRGGDAGQAGADVSREQEQLDRAIALSLQEAAAAIEREDVPTPAPGLDRAAPSSPTVEIADDAMSGPEPPEPFSTAYRLHGIISHLGTLASSGHFIADVYDTASEQWVRHDDSVVTVVSRSTVLNEKREVDGYMFFYVHEPLVKQQKLGYQQARDSSKLKLEGRF